MIRHEDIDDGPICSKPHKVCCIPCYVPCNLLFFPCRYAVSGKKQRYKKDGFDLDLTYINPHVIVHGFPATGLEHIYRNPRLEIRRFMDTYHRDQYKMYNFCCEPGRGYDPSIFYDRVERYPFKDHHIPPLETMVAFAQSAREWLEGGLDRVVNMHCKAGKGRAGVMCCVLLVRTGAASSALDAMAQYDARRVTNNKGLTLTSQRKSVIFYEYIWRYCWGITGNIGHISATQATQRGYKVPYQPPLPLVQIEVLNLPNRFIQKYLTYYRVTIHKVTSSRPELLYDSQKKKFSSIVNQDAATQHNTLLQNILAVDCAPSILQGNFKITLYSGGMSMIGTIKWQKVLELQHNTYFMPKKNSIVDFGVDQMDMSKSMKKAILQSGKEPIGNGLIDDGVNAIDQIVLRLKFDYSHVSSSYNADDEDQLLFDPDFGYTSPHAHPTSTYMRLAIADDDEYPNAEQTEELGIFRKNQSLPQDSAVGLAEDETLIEPSPAAATTTAAGIELVPMAADSDSIVEPTDVQVGVGVDTEGAALDPLASATGEANPAVESDTNGAAPAVEEPAKKPKRISLTKPLIKFVGRMRRTLHMGGTQSKAAETTNNDTAAATTDATEPTATAAEQSLPIGDNISPTENQEDGVGDEKEEKAEQGDTGVEENNNPPAAKETSHGLVEDTIETGRKALQQLFTQVLSLGSDANDGNKDNNAGDEVAGEEIAETPVDMAMAPLPSSEGSAVDSSLSSVVIATETEPTVSAGHNNI